MTRWEIQYDKDMQVRARMVLHRRAVAAYYPPTDPYPVGLSEYRLKTEALGRRVQAYLETAP